MLASGVLLFSVAACSAGTGSDAGGQPGTGQEMQGCVHSGIALRDLNCSRVQISQEKQRFPVPQSNKGQNRRDASPDRPAVVSTVPTVPDQQFCRIKQEIKPTTPPAPQGCLK